MNQTTKKQMENSEASEIDFKSIILKYLKFWPWYTICILIALSLAHFKLRYTPNIYTSETTIQILTKEESSAIADLASLSSPLSGKKVNIENEMHIIRSYGILEKVVKDQNLTQHFYNLGTMMVTQIEDPPFNIIIPEGTEPTGNYIVSFSNDGFEITNEYSEKGIFFEGKSTKNISHNFPFDLELKDFSTISKIDPIKISLTNTRSATLALKGRVNVSYIGQKTSLLKISISGKLPSELERILNSLVRIYGEEGEEDKRMVDKRTVDFIDQRFLTLAQELDTIEVYKKEFKQKNKLFNLEANASMEIMKESETDEAIFELENQLMVSKLLFDSLVNEKGQDLLPNNLGIESSSINILVEGYNELLISRNRLSKSAGENNPNVILLEKRLEERYSSILKSIKGHIFQLKQSLKKIEIRNRRYEDLVSELPMKEKQYREIKRKQEIKESLFLLLLEKRETSAIKYAIKEPVIKVIDYAMTRLAGPNRKSAYLAAFVCGLLVPLLIVYLVFLINTKISSIQDIEAVVSSVAPVLGSIPLLKDEKKLEEDSSRSFLKEAFRTLLTNVKFVVPGVNDGKGKTILVTSSIKGEGKTLVSYNLASEVSSHKVKVILIGADLRNPQLHKYLDVENVNIGLSSYLNDEGIDVNDLEFFNSSEMPNLDILFAGAIPPNPTSLLSNDRFKELLIELKKTYDYIIIDSAPTLLVSDTLIFGKLVDTTIYVTRANHTEKNIIEYSKRLIEDGKLNNVAYVLNGVDTRSGYGYNYNYAYSYSYTYDDDEQIKKWYQIFKK